ncbi:MULTISPECIES: response regulator transcription factor [unclassified Paenibacillus]|uniref:response regulator transcription factor n=1 Tax=unclassified Paenibacillus TaxID=185978 RepID=UPI001C0FDF60|nr:MULTISPECIES: response regulator transcription factor [unclassified Paenibacillus]MBU5442236.1 response regulator transcription factor [Paenibacillus sp. MSJ-34]CAH0118980.1 Transcriptional regulatory protein DegU [Paenibacillus sp. CECT 9249]
MERNIRIVVVDDMEAHRRRLERMIADCADMTCVGSAESGEEAVAVAEKLQPDIVLMDIEMEDKLAGVQAAKRINEQFPEMKIIVVTVHKDDNIIFAAFQTGIIDYVLKSAPKEEITEAIRLAYADRSPIRPMIAHKIREEFARIKKTENSLLYIIRIISELTPSELQVLKLLCEYKTRRQIAEERIVEYETVKKQISSILKKFHMSSAADVVKTVNELRIFEVLKKL